MAKIQCPKCGEVIDVSDNVISKVTEEEIARRLNVREKEIKALIESQSNIKTKELESKIKILENDLARRVKEKELEVTNSYNVQIEELKNKIKLKDNEIVIEKNKAKIEYNDQINKLKEEISKFSVEKELAVTNALNKKEDEFRKERQDLENQIQYYREFKAKLTVKEIGESLEQYCENKFNEQRLSSYPNAYFEKDNDISINKQKGDFIFRDYVLENDSKREIVSIMFDMKNEEDNSSTKHKNEEFFKKLDSDRNAKKCEYAVLVSTLEADNQFYGGITDVSYKYPKMYVVRPQCFMAIISLIRNAALRSEHAQKELQEYKKQNIDLTNFEKSVEDFKEGFMQNVQHSSKHFNLAIKGIEDTIAKLEKTKKELQDSMMQLGRANNKIQDLTVKKLMKNSPSLIEKLQENKDK